MYPKFTLSDVSIIDIKTQIIDGQERRVVTALLGNLFKVTAEERGPFRLNGNAQNIHEKVSKHLLNALSMILHTFDVEGSK